MSSDARKSWAVVLAGGEHARVASPRRAFGDDGPTQFAALAGERSLLQRTLERVASSFAAERTLVVVDRAHEALAREQLDAHGGVEIVLQPEPAGTAPALLLALARIRAREPYARVAVVPSDHHAQRPDVLVEGLERALEAVGAQVVLLGAQAESAETDYGWILPQPGAHAATGAWPVDVFVEKPTQRWAERLLQEGAWWNTFICVARASVLWAEAHYYVPAIADWAERLERAHRRAIGGADAALAASPSGDFCRDVLQNSARLAMVPIRGSGWSDWGSPRRVFASRRGSEPLARPFQRATGTR